MKHGKANQEKKLRHLMLYIREEHDLAMVRQQLMKLAKKLGYVSIVGRFKGEGNPGELIAAIAAGALQVRKKPRATYGGKFEDFEGIFLDRRDDTPGG